MFDPIAFSIGSIHVRWYGILMALGFSLGYYISIKIAKYRNINKKDIEDFFIILIPSAIIGARLLHVIERWDLYKDNLISILYIWNGGIAFFGGLLGVGIALYYFTKKRKIKFYDMADVLVVPLALGLAIGRIGNFINQEIYGRITNLPWGVEFDNVEGKRHPSQIYASLKNLFVFYVLNRNIKKRLPSGFIFWSFIVLYSGIRFFLDFTKDLPILFLGLKHAQVYAFIAFFIGIYMLKKLRKNSKSS